MTASYKIALAAAGSLLVVVIGVLIFRGEPSDPLAGMDGAGAAQEHGEQGEAGDADRGVTLSDEPAVAVADPVESVTIGRSPFVSERFDMDSAELYPGEPTDDAPLETADGAAAGESAAGSLELPMPAEPEPTPVVEEPSLSDTLTTRPDEVISPREPDEVAVAANVPPATPPKYTMHTIASGETFSSIAQKKYGDDKHWVAIAQANPLIDPNRLRVGQEVKLPDPEDVGKAAEEAAAVPANNDLPGGATSYTVKSGDSLSAIAVQFYGKASAWKVIHEANRQLIGPKPTGLKVGMKLKIPPPTNGAS